LGLVRWGGEEKGGGGGDARPIEMQQKRGQLTTDIIQKKKRKKRRKWEKEEGGNPIAPNKGKGAAVVPITETQRKGEKGGSGTSSFETKQKSIELGGGERKGKKKRETVAPPIKNSPEKKEVIDKN